MLLKHRLNSLLAKAKLKPNNLCDLLLRDNEAKTDLPQEDEHDEVEAQPNKSSMSTRRGS